MDAQELSPAGRPWTAVGSASEWPDEGGRLVRIETRRVAVFHHAGGWYALDDRCPHERIGLAGGPLKDGLVTCPGHRWKFRLADGVIAVGPPGINAIVNPVRVRDGVVEIG
jgi:nitrite reductase (NADH) small subunit